MGRSNTNARVEEAAEEVYCFCRRSMDVDEYMICCDACSEWFHGVCVSLESEDADQIDQWFCPQCTETGGHVTTMKKRCANADCGKFFRSSANMSAKYCSDDCGIHVAKKRLRVLMETADGVKADNAQADAAPIIDGNAASDTLGTTKFRLVVPDAPSLNGETVGKTTSSSNDDAHDLGRLEQLAADERRLENNIRALESRRSAIAETVRFVNAFSSAWIEQHQSQVSSSSSDDEEGRGKGRQQRRHLPPSTEPMCGFDQSLVTTVFHGNEDVLSHDKQLAAFQAFYARTPNTQLLPHLPPSLCTNPRFHCKKHYGAQLPKKSSLDHMLNNEDRATVDPSITVFRLPPWAHLQVQCADTELQLDKQELERVHREQTRVRDRLDARKRSVVRMRLENCADEEERWSSATMVLSIPLAKSGHGAAAVASPGTVDRTPIIATTTLYHG